MRFNRQSKKGLWLPEFYTNYYCKGGWFETKLDEKSIHSAEKSVQDQGNGHISWSNDSGVVVGPKSNYAVALFSINKSLLLSSYFPTKELARAIYELMEATE